MSGGPESRFLGRVYGAVRMVRVCTVRCGWCGCVRCGADGAGVYGAVRMVRVVPCGSVAYAATEYLMLLMLGLCTRNMSS